MGLDAELEVSKVVRLGGGLSWNRITPSSYGEFADAGFETLALGPRAGVHLLPRTFIDPWGAAFSGLALGRAVSRLDPVYARMEGTALVEGPWKMGFVAGLNLGIDVHVSERIIVGPVFTLFTYMEFGDLGEIVVSPEIRVAAIF